MDRSKMNVVELHFLWSARRTQLRLKASQQPDDSNVTLRTKRDFLSISRSAFTACEGVVNICLNSSYHSRPSVRRVQQVGIATETLWFTGRVTPGSWLPTTYSSNGSDPRFSTIGPVLKSTSAVQTRPSSVSITHSTYKYCRNANANV
jgi:hypothetical protein